MHVYFTCPACAHRWLGAILHPEDGVTLDALAKQPYCPLCDAKPPMHVEVL